mgnify:CR=1 FL=1
MKNLHKWLMLAPLLLVALLPLTSCQTTSAASSSVIEEVAVDTEAAVCSDLQPEPITSRQFNEAPQWVRDYLVAMTVAWETRCA